MFSYIHVIVAFSEADTTITNKTNNWPKTVLFCISIKIFLNCKDFGQLDYHFQMLLKI